MTSLELRSSRVSREVPSARQRVDGDDEVTGAGLHLSVGERSNFKKFPTHTQDHGDA